MYQLKMLFSGERGEWIERTEAIVAYFKVISSHSHGMTEENYKKL
jgi:hypothetical protein